MVLLIWLGKFVKFVSRMFNLGSGSTWPGHLVLRIYPKFIKELVARYPLGVVVIAGTNGKTTTTRLLSSFLSADGKNVSSNEAGANLLNGVASSLIHDSSLLGSLQSLVGIFEVDENALPLMLKEVTPKVIVILNLFRDQLDRYGEIDYIAEKWFQALKKLPETTTLILNGDDPTIANLAKFSKARVLFFGLGDASLYQKMVSHLCDSLFCPRCGARLNFIGVYFAHLGIWSCSKCPYRSPDLDLSAKNLKSPLPGIYNRYNLAAAILAAQSLGVCKKLIYSTIPSLSPAFGRLEEFSQENKKIRLLLAKNPAGFNEALRTINSFQDAQDGIFFILNDNIPDGCDVSWIWDVDFERFSKKWRWVIVSGKRAEDMVLRLKYARLDWPSTSLIVEKDLKKAISRGLEITPVGGTLSILPTYSAMLEVRKILSGRSLI